MLQVIHILEVFLPLAYAGVFALYLTHFLKKQDKSIAFRGTHALYGVLLVHLGYLVMRGIEFHHFPVSSRAEFLSIVALCVGFVYAFAENRHKEAQTGVFFVGIMVIFQFLSALLIEDSTHHPLLHENPIYSLHVIFMVFGFAALAVSALYALMYIMLARQLKSRDLGMIFRRLPPLSVLEGMSKRATFAGIVCLGIGLGTGHFVAFYVLDNFSPWDPKIIITDIAWLIYVISFVLMKVRGLSGLRMGYLSLFGYLAFIATMVIVNTFASTFHSFQ